MDKHLESAKVATENIFAPQGYMAQAQDAHASGGGAALLQYFQTLLTTLGPIIGPMVISYLQSLFHLIPTPPAA